jgi:gentisate 1,2-dioxygenase
MIEQDNNAAPASDRATYYARIGAENLTPLWETLHLVVPPQPNSPVLPAKWDYDGVVRKLVMEAGGVISAEEAERRVLILENPGLRGRGSVTQSLYAGLQLILPGEVARAHRHTQSALRFIVEGHGAYTAVDGEKTLMNPGDLILTPGWQWHDHGNESDGPMVWMDGLDIPLVQFFDTGFAEAANATSQSVVRPSGTANMKFGSNLVPVDWQPAGKASPVFSYPYARTREVLDAMQRSGAPDPFHGYKMRFINPTTGSHVMPTIGAFVQKLEAGMTTSPYRSTDGTIFSVVEGTGVSNIGGATITWKPRDIFVAPSWAIQSHRADTEAVLFSYSDRPVHEALGLWREERIVRS